MGGLFTLSRLSRLTFAIVLISSLGCASLTLKNNGDYLRFRSIGRIPVAEGKINGKKAYFIIDTGASCSLLDESAARWFAFKSKVAADEHVTGLNGLSELKRATNCIVNFGPLRITHHTFKTKDMMEIVSFIQNHEGVIISGIIGADILHRYRISINFSNHTLLFPTSPAKPAETYVNQVAQEP